MDHSVRLTFSCIDEVLPILVELFDKPVRLLQLGFVHFDFLPEAGTVQITLAKLQRV